MSKFFRSLKRCIQHWTKPATPMLISGFLSDLPRSRTDLLVDNAGWYFAKGGCDKEHYIHQGCLRQAQTAMLRKKNDPHRPNQPKAEPFERFTF